MKMVNERNINRIRVLFTSIVLLIAGHATAQSVDSKLIRLHDLIVEIVPIGSAMESMATTSEYWPLKSAPSSPSQSFSCLRSKLTASEYSRNVRDRVASYAKAYPDRINGDLKALEKGAGVLKQLFAEDGTNIVQTSGLDLKAYAKEKKWSRKDVDLASTLLFHEQFAPLRKLLGVNDNFAAKKRSSSYVEKFDVIVDMRTDYLIAQINNCREYSAELLKPSMRLPNEPLTLTTAITTTRPTQARAKTFDAQCNERRAPQGADDPPPNVQQPRADPLHPLSVPEFSGNGVEPGQKITALVKIHITELGQVARAVLDKATGIDEIDGIAINAPGAWQFIPAQINGEPACMWVTIPLTFANSNKVTP
jgi:TonB family protein